MTPEPLPITRPLTITVEPPAEPTYTIGGLTEADLRRIYDWSWRNESGFHRPRLHEAIAEVAPDIAESYKARRYGGRSVVQAA